MRSASRFRFGRVWTVLALIFLLLVLALLPTIYDELRATSLLLSISGMHVPLISGFDTNPVTEELITFPSLTPTLGRIYHPAGIAHPSAIVVVHGAQRLGMDDPRLRDLARALASHGYLVLTPQVNDLADYNVTRESAVVIGDAVHELARRSGATRVGLFGLSFAGGMALIAATDPAVARQLSVVVAVGAHDDLHRVLEYYMTNRARAPDGSVFDSKANEYGPLVTAYSHVPVFFSPRDVALARRVLRDMLWQEWPQAHAEAAKLSPQGQALMAKLFAGDVEALAPDILRDLDAAKPEIDAASPHFYLSRLHVPVMLLAGATDNVVPPTETLWLAHDMPPGVLKAVLVTPALVHVELGKKGWEARWRLIEWIRQMLGLLDTARAARG